MSIKDVSNVIDFQEAKDRATSVWQTKRIKDIQDRFERAMGWEQEEVPKTKRQERIQKRQRR